MKVSVFQVLGFLFVTGGYTVQAQTDIAITWKGAGLEGSTDTAWDKSANWAHPGSFDKATTSLDFGDITSNTVLSAEPVSVPETIKLSSIYFGNATSPAAAPNITINGNGTADQVTLVFSTANPVNIYVGPPGLTAGTGPVYTLGKDITLNLGKSFTNPVNFGAYFTSNNVSGELSGTSVLLTNSLVTGSSGNGGRLAFGPLSVYGPELFGRAAAVLTNDNNSFDAPITGNGYLGYTSIGDVGKGNSSLGAPVTAVNGTITLGNGGPFAYIGATDQASNRAIDFVALHNGAALANDASVASTLTLMGPVSESIDGALRVGATSGNILMLTGDITDGTSGPVGLLKDTFGPASYYYDATGVYHFSTNTGTVVLGGANTYSGGTIVTAGTLLVSNTSGSGTGSGNVSIGGTFGGTGIVAPSKGNNISVSEGGILSPGGVPGAAIGKLTLDGKGTENSLLKMNEGAKYAFDLGSGNTSDQIVFLNYASGDLTSNANIFTFSGVQEGRYIIFKFFSDDGTTPTASGLSAANFDLANSTGLKGFTATLDFGTVGEVILDVVAVGSPRKSPVSP